MISMVMSFQDPQGSFLRSYPQARYYYRHKNNLFIKDKSKDKRIEVEKMLVFFRKIKYLKNTPATHTYRVKERIALKAPKMHTFCAAFLSAVTTRDLYLPLF